MLRREQHQDIDASRLERSPLKKGGTNFKTHTLVQVSNQRLEYKATVGYKMIAGIFLSIGIIVFVVIFMNKEVPILIGLIGLVFLGIGGFIFNNAMTLIVFDKSMGYFWKGEKAHTL